MPLYAAGVSAIPQYTVEQYDLGFAVIVGERRLDIEVDGERDYSLISASMAQDVVRWSIFECS